MFQTENTHIFTILEPPKDIQSRILTEDEGCGIPKGNSSGFKIIGGEGAEEGWLMHNRLLHDSNYVWIRIPNRKQNKMDSVSIQVNFHGWHCWDMLTIGTKNRGNAVRIH